MTEKIGVVGLWHLGCVIAASWAKKGHKVTGFDYNKDRIKNLNLAKAPIFEPNLDELIKKEISNNNLQFVDEIKALNDCDFIFLCYDTPVRDDDSSDTTILDNSVDDLKRIMKDGSILVVSSQSPVGYCTTLRNKIKDVNNTVELAYSPENLRLGDAINCYFNPGRIILGTADGDTEKRCVELFAEITTHIISMNLESSEMVKHGINSFLSMSIVFANHIADICELKGAKIDDVVNGLKSDDRIGRKAYLSPGIGFSGGTLGRDLKVLESVNSESNGHAKIFGLIHGLNADRKYAIVDRTEKLLNGISGKTISVVGLTYKPGTSTLRRSLPLEIVELLKMKNAVVNVYDPKADFSELNAEHGYNVKNSIAEAVKDSSIVILMTEWNDFRQFDWSSVIHLMKDKIFFDTKNFLDEKVMTQYGFKYNSIGR